MEACRPKIQMRTYDVKYQEPMTGWVADCECGWQHPHYWATEEGARVAWVHHLLAVNVPEEWKPDIYTNVGAL